MSARKFLSLLPLQDEGLFRKALNGAAFTNDVLCHFNETGSDLRKFRGERDSRKHRFWACPAFHAERSELSADFLQLVDRLPACLTQAGWAICSETHDEWWRYLIELQHGPPIDSSNVSGWMPWLGGSLHRWKLLSPHKWRSPVCLMVGMPRKSRCDVARQWYS